MPAGSDAGGFFVAECFHLHESRFIWACNNVDFFHNVNSAITKRRMINLY